jgi:hypothetical protein
VDEPRIIGPGLEGRVIFLIFFSFVMFNFNIFAIFVVTRHPCEILAHFPPLKASFYLHLPSAESICGCGSDCNSPTRHVSCTEGTIAFIIAVHVYLEVVYVTLIYRGD